MPASVWVLTGISFLLVVVTLVPLSRNPKWWIRGWDFPRLQLATVAIALMIFTGANLALISSSVAWRLDLLLLAVQFGCLLVQLWWVFPYTLFAAKEVPRFKPEKMESTERFRILTSNVLQTNRHADKLIAHVRSEQPDLLVAVETDQWWMQQLDAIVDDYPHVGRCPLDNLYGMVVYSRWPMLDAKTEFLVEDGVPSMHFDWQMPSGRKVEVHCVHPAPPSPTENEESTERDAELVMIARRVKNKQHPVIVTGDLNDVAWSSTTRLFRKISGLLDPRVGRGVYNTFHAQIPLLRWPLDHLFHSEHFALVTLKRLSSIGSDHFPILAELALLEDKLEHTEGLELEQEDREHAAEIMQRAAEKANG